MNGIDLLLPKGQPIIARWKGGEGLMALLGPLGGAAVQLCWAPDIDSQFNVIGEPLRSAGALSDPFDLPRGVLTVQLIGGTPSEVFAAATVYPIPKSFIRGSP